MNKFVATAIALALGTAAVAAQAQTGGKKFDPYTQGAKSGQKFDPYSEGAKTGDKFDPYSQGANKSTRSDLTDASAPEAKKPTKSKTKKSKKKAASRRRPAETGLLRDRTARASRGCCALARRSGANAYGACVSRSSAVTSMRCTFPSCFTSVRSTKASAGQYQSVICIN